MPLLFNKFYTDKYLDYFTLFYNIDNIIDILYEHKSLPPCQIPTLLKFSFKASARLLEN